MVKASILNEIRNNSPLVHNITNYVVMNNTANALLSVGASPVMAYSLDEVEDIISISSSLVINMGTLSELWVDSMIKAGKKASSEEKNVYEEGCLSIPEHFAEVTRPELVQVEWIDLNGKEHSEEFNGLKSTCVQHEIDHLNGKLFIDYLGPIKRQMITRKMQKFKREKLRGSE